ncbi:MAG: TraR/DksA C4-type zinc finger protein [Bacteroidota bacterium]|nr:TraR/DksA C4-type zinc finger protein [Bacteroidota bacterium]
MMTQELRAEIKDAIDERIKQLSEDINVLKEHMKPVTLKCVVDKANKMDMISNNAVKDTVYQTSLHRLNILKMLSQKVNDPDFGNCRKCNRPIDPNRLKFLPESTLCIHCAR